MANRRIIFTAEQIEEIETARKDNKNKNTERRLCVLSMKAQGKNIGGVLKSRIAIRFHISGKK